MRHNRKVIAVAAAVAALGVGGAGAAYGVSGSGSEERVTGPDAKKAEAAALDAVGGGTVTEVEHQDGDGAGVFEVEVKRDGGSQVEVHIDESYNSVGQAPDDDSGKDEKGEDPSN